MTFHALVRAAACAAVIGWATPAVATGQSARADSARPMQAAEPKDGVPALPAPFVRRSQRKGGGKFMTTADIAKLGAANTVQLLARVSGSDYKDIGSGEFALVGRRGNKSPFGAPVENELCLVGIAVNEQRVQPGFDLKSMKPDEIVALEYYNGPSTIPMELGGTNAENAHCGLIVIWLKNR